MTRGNAPYTHGARFVDRDQLIKFSVECGPYHRRIMGKQFPFGRAFQWPHMQTCGRGQELIGLRVISNPGGVLGREGVWRNV